MMRVFREILTRMRPAIIALAALATAHAASAQAVSTATGARGVAAPGRVAKEKQVARRFYAVVDAIGAGRMQVSAFDTIAAAGFRAHLPGSGVVDRDGFKGVMQAFGAGFPGAMHDIHDVVAEGDRVVVRMTWRGKHTGPFQGVAPTGRDIEMSEMGMLRIADGKVAEFWPLFDSLTLMTGIGKFREADTTR